MSFLIAELHIYVRHNFYTLSSRNHYNKAIRNTTIQQHLHFTDEEKRCCVIGLYFDTYEEYQKARRLQKMKRSRERYTKLLEQDNKLRRTDKKVVNKNILKENPLMTYKEFFALTGLSKSTYDVYKRELGNTKEKHFQQQREYYLQPFCENPNISCDEYVKQLNCSTSSYRKYKKIYFNSNNI